EPAHLISECTPGHQALAVHSSAEAKCMVPSSVYEAARANTIWERLLHYPTGAPRVYYSPYSGRISTTAFPASPAVRGGILADEMGLGKTLEVLACVLSHRCPTSSVLPSRPPSTDDSEAPIKVSDAWMQRVERQERIECVCGKNGPAYPEEDSDSAGSSDDFDGEWWQCDTCDAWMHADCLPARRRGRKKAKRAVMAEEAFVCGSCARVKAAAPLPPGAVCGATLIVCPVAILSQWQREIRKHTHLGAVKVITYLGQAQWQLATYRAVACVALCAVGQ
ncbi:hypothetical protein CYMTET_35136, partial [Cymbomonas tetramitiformis]